MLKYCRFSSAYFIDKNNYSLINFLCTFFIIYKLCNFKYYNIVVFFCCEILQYYRFFVFCYVNFYCVFALKNILSAFFANFSLYVFYSSDLFVEKNQTVF